MEKQEPENVEARLRRLEADGLIAADCKGCDEYYAAARAGTPAPFAPSHKASSMCESGKRSHCTCSACF